MKTPRGASAVGTLVIFIFLLIGLGIVWVYTGGPSRSISTSGPFLSPPPVPSFQFTGYGYSIGNTPGATNTPPTTSTTTNTTSKPPPKATPPTQATTTQSLWDYFFYYDGGFGLTTGEISPYADSVKLTIGNAKQSNPTGEYVTITTSAKLASSITITGWSLESNSSSLTALIGSAAGIPYLGQVNSEEPISLGPNSKMHVITGRPPNGTSFRVNKCTGYFEQFQNFTPQLSIACPRAQDEMLRYPEKLSGNDICIKYLGSIGQCEYRSLGLPVNIGNACQEFILNTLSYNGCITVHKNDPDFYAKEWRVFLKRDQELYKNTHDRIRLLDENKKVVAEVRY